MKMNMMPIMSKKIQENKGADHTHGTHLEKNEEIRVDQTNKEERTLGKWEKGKKKKETWPFGNWNHWNILVKYIEIYNPHHL